MTLKRLRSFPVVVDFVLPMINPLGFEGSKFNKKQIQIKDVLGREVKKK